MLYSKARIKLLKSFHIYSSLAFEIRYNILLVVRYFNNVCDSLEKGRIKELWREEKIVERVSHSLLHTNGIYEGKERGKNGKKLREGVAWKRKESKRSELFQSIRCRKWRRRRRRKINLRREERRNEWRREDGHEREEVE